MKAWILISFYLLKDIWRRWFETPGGVFSRLLVALILALLLLVIDAAFTLTAASVREKISQLGVRTIVLMRAVGVNEARTENSYLVDLLRPIENDGTVLRLMQAGRRGVDELGKRRMLYVYDSQMLGPLMSVLPSKPQSEVLVISEDFPPGMTMHVVINDETEVDACVIRPPTWLLKFGANEASILLPESEFSDLLDDGFYELIVFMGDDDANLTKIESDVRTILALEDMTGVQITSPAGLLKELDELENTQRNWRGGFGLFGGLAVALVFGSISILEYRQNRFILALLKSFGVPSLLLVARYLVESVCLVTLAAFLARAAAIQLHPVIFKMIGVEPNLVDLTVIDPYAWSAVWAQFGGLGFGALLSVVPIVFAMRTAVGKILA